MSDYVREFYAHRADAECLRGASFILRECEECGLVYQRDIPNVALMEKLYEHWIAPVAAPRSNSTALKKRYTREILQVIDYFGNPVIPLRTLDFGMGWGIWALTAKSLGCDSCGTELSRQRIEYARANGVTIVEPDSIGTLRYDFINSEQVMEHLSQPAETLRKLAGALSDGGVVRVSVPDGSTIRRRLRRMDWDAPKGSKDSLNPVAPLEHINCFNRSSLLRLAAEAGLREVTLPIRVQYRYPTEDAGLSTRLKDAVRPIWRMAVRRPDCVYLRAI